MQLYVVMATASLNYGYSKNFYEFRHKAEHVLGYMMQEQSKQCSSHPKKVVEIKKSEAFENILFLIQNFKRCPIFQWNMKQTFFYLFSLQHYISSIIILCIHLLVLIPNGSIY